MLAASHDTLTSRVWYRAVLSNDQIVAGHVNKIRDLFAKAISAAGQPPGACLFMTSHDARSDRVQPEVDNGIPTDADALFFSPAAISSVAPLIAAYGAEPSAPPERSQAALLVGQDSDWELLSRPTH